MLATGLRCGVVRGGNHIASMPDFRKSGTIRRPLDHQRPVSSGEGEGPAERTERRAWGLNSQAIGTSVAPISAEGKCVGLHAGIEEPDRERAIGNRAPLPVPAAVG
jgi:hypothetical protein